ncbi:GDSL esterase/lipase At5g37690-like isoform X3 [Arachis stenosperma]|uniref:GDSL esterase/lipase At5g37690-like isoform X3 n=1 Tax=Arachis stenosperma TaxID=217475 RepID=UPI0025AB8052|nr:GDSL esterase/lipase At5g37690-like isoform X3 [Arachis stenosperma]
MKNMLIIIFLAAEAMVVGSRLLLNVVGYRDPAVPAVYIFGDSTFDVGTNNFLNDTKSKADMPFYGIDYSPSHSKPTGRFSNGYNTADCIVQLLGFKESPPPFLYLVQNDTEDFNTQILKGVNFAGGGAGILHHTGKKRFGRVISMEEQIEQFSRVGDNMTRYLNESAAKGIINKSLILISVGSNDINEFLMFNVSNSSSLIQQLQQFLPDLIASYQAHLTNLINLGGRKFGILGLAPLGSVPDVRGSYGLSDVATACCGNQTLTGGTPCSPNATVCEFRHKFLFWDRHHPTEYGSQLAANDLFNGGSEFVSPFNLSTLVQTS